jgi:hypothetical protein
VTTGYQPQRSAPVTLPRQHARQHCKTPLLDSTQDYCNTRQATRIYLCTKGQIQPQRFSNPAIPHARQHCGLCYAGPPRIHTRQVRSAYNCPASATLQPKGALQGTITRSQTGTQLRKRARQLQSAYNGPASATLQLKGALQGTVTRSLTGNRHALHARQSCLRRNVHCGPHARQSLRASRQAVHGVQI